MICTHTIVVLFLILLHPQLLLHNVPCYHFLILTAIFCPQHVVHLFSTLWVNMVGKIFP